MTRAPAWAKSWAATPPTWPKPWMATRSPSRVSPRRRASSSTQTSTPRPVASKRPRLPPTATGLPVTTAGTVWPWPME